MENKKPRLKLVWSRSDPERSGDFRRINPEPETGNGPRRKILEYADQILAEAESDFLNHCGAERAPEAGVLEAISRLSPSDALEIQKELNLIAYLSASREISLAAKSKLAETDYLI